MDTSYAATLIRAWITRREAKGIAVPADDVWTRIRTTWPRAPEWQHERLFQESVPKPPAVARRRERALAR